jgi:hypothetical protein
MSQPDYGTYELTWYVRDRRYKVGIRRLDTYTYHNVEAKWMQEEARVLKRTLYADDKFAYILERVDE